MGKTLKDQLGRVVSDNETGLAPAVILVNPQLGENIGAACRLATNLSFLNLDW